MNKQLKKISLTTSIISLLILSLLFISLSGCARTTYTEKYVAPAEPQIQSPAVNNSFPIKEEPAQPKQPQQPPIFSMKIYYGDEKGNLMKEVFAGDQEAGEYYLWIKNIGTYNASCTVTSHDEDVATRTVTSKEKYSAFLRPGHNDSRLYTFNGFKSAIDELPDTVECKSEGINNKVQKEKPSINQYYWKRYYVESGDAENPNDLAKKIDVGGNLSIILHGFIYDFYVLENIQNDNCTIRYQEGKYVLSPGKTQMVSNVKVTLMESRFKYCAILFW